MEDIIFYILADWDEGICYKTIDNSVKTIPITNSKGFPRITT